MRTKRKVPLASKTLRMATILAALAAGPAAAQRPVPLPIETGKPRAVPVTMPVGPPPVGVTVSGTPAQARVAWQPTPGVSGYSIVRWKQADPNCCRAQSPILAASATSWDDLVRWSGTWVYRVTALYPNNSPGFVDVSYLYPEPQTPAGFKAEQTGEGTVTLSWQPVPNASYYVLGGPPTNQGMRVNGTSATITGVPLGNQTWQVATNYDAGGASGAAGSQFISTSLNVVRRSGRYRVWVESIRVDQETGDPPNDGHGDEAYVSAYVQMLDRRNGALLQAATVRSAIHGDVTYWPAPARVARGTASNMGGLKTGDVIPVVGQAQVGGDGWPELILWEGLLTDGVDEIIVWPVLWESDGDLTAFQTWSQSMPARARDKLALAKGNSTGSGVQAVSTGVFSLPDLRTWQPCPVFCDFALAHADRPLGLVQGSLYEKYAATEWAVVVTRERIEASLSSPSSFGGLAPGIIPVVMKDNSANLTKGVAGSYTVYLGVGRLP